MQIRTGKMLGPQLFLCGPYFRDPEQVSEAVQRVDGIGAAGYDAIKIKNNVTREEFDAIVEEAKKENLLILGHTPRLPGLRHALESGLNLAHEEELLYGAFSPDGIYGNVDVGPNLGAREGWRKNASWHGCRRVRNHGGILSSR
jgi:hypothetical protein